MPTYQPTLLCSLGDVTEKRGGLQFMTLNDVTSMLNHTQIAIFKNDIEGFEYELIGGACAKVLCSIPLLADTCRAYGHRSCSRPTLLSCVLPAGLTFEDSCNFPLQLSMEIHYRSLYEMTKIHRVRLGLG